MESHLQYPWPMQFNWLQILSYTTSKTSLENLPMPCNFNSRQINDGVICYTCVKEKVMHLLLCEFNGSEDKNKITSKTCSCHSVSLIATNMQQHNAIKPFVASAILLQSRTWVQVFISLTEQLVVENSIPKFVQRAMEHPGLGGGDFLSYWKCAMIIQRHIQILAWCISKL